MNLVRPTASPRSAALPVLIVYVVVLLGIPSVLIVRQLGAAGTPAQILAIAMLAWWVGSRVLVRRDRARAHPVKWLMFGLVLAVVASYTAGMTRPIVYAEEVRSADRSILALCAWCGAVLIMCDGMGARRELLRLLRVIAAGATVIAALGVLQYLLRVNLADYIHPPGLIENRPLGGLISRSDYQRVYATTAHPIEFGVVLSSALPLVIHFARYSATSLQRRRWWFAVALVAIALPMSVSRSGALGGLIAVGYLFYTWPARLKLRAVAVFAVGALAMSAAVPGLLGTIRGLFLNASDDPSTQGRTDDYGPVLHYFTEHPLFGQGIGTFIPSIYRTLDNAYLGLLVDSGLVGLLAIVTLFLGTLCVAGHIRRHTRSDEVRDLAQSLKAGLAVLVVNAATFDALSFPMCVGMIFLMIGSVGALWTIEHRTTQRTARSGPPARAMLAVGTVLVLALGAAGLGVLRAEPEFQAYGVVLITPSSQRGDPAYIATSSTQYLTSVLRDVMGSREVRRTLRSRAPRYEVALKDGRLVMDSDIRGELSSTLLLEASADDATRAESGLAAVIAETERQLVAVQRSAGVADDLLVHSSAIQRNAAFPVAGRPSRAKLGLLVLAALLAAGWLRVARPTPATPPGPLPGRRTKRPTDELVTA